MKQKSRSAGSIFSRIFSTQETKRGMLKSAQYFPGLIISSIFVFSGLVMITQFIKDGLYPLASVTGAIIIFISLVYFKRKFSPYRWMSIAIVFVIIFNIYPMVSTVLISLSNMSGGHLVTKQQAIQKLESKTYLPDGGRSFKWNAYKKGKNSFLLLLESESGEFFVAVPGKPITKVSGSLKKFGNLSSSGIPEQIEGFSRLLKKDVVPIIGLLGELKFGSEKQTIAIQSLQKASELRQKYRYDPKRDFVFDNEFNTEFRPVNGTFTAESGEELVPGFKIPIGIRNYKRFIGNEGYRRPITTIILWNISFALFSVTISFLLGMLIALAFEDVPGKRIIRTILIIPYPIPVLVSITVWKGLMNESMGLITKTMEVLTGFTPHFFTDSTWARFALILINVYLSYPYFYILASGAIRAIPHELFQAAEIDGATSFDKVTKITMPLILKILMPLLVASFSFNFNNFTLIWGFNAGLPAMADSIVPMGHTDLLISFIYRLGFSTANAANYGFAAAITVLLFIFVTTMVLLQLRTTNALKED